MANRKKEVYKPKPMTEGKRNLIQGLLQEYDIQSAEDIQDALKDLLSGTIQDMLETEMDEHLGYDRYERSGEPSATRSRIINCWSSATLSIWGNPTTICVNGNVQVGSLWDNMGNLTA